MQVYVRETLHVLDYKDNIVDTIFNSEDHITPGYAYDITISEANTGYSDLTFSMPNTILTDNADKIKNPKLRLLTPLVKLRYNRQVYYMGEETITVREPVGYGDKISYRQMTYNKGDVIENYIMDYIVQPVDKKRNSLAIDTTFTAMDYPRFNLSKKRVGMTIDQDTVTEEEFSLYQNKPLDVPGKVKYNPYHPDQSGEPESWDAEHAVEYPLTKEEIETMMRDATNWDYGLLATVFYWRISSTGRFKGRMYYEGDYLALHLYDFFNLSEAGIDPELHVDRYAWEWFSLQKVTPLLCPNNADNYLKHILKGTNWSIAQRHPLDDSGEEIIDEWEDDVDIVQVSVPNPKGQAEIKELVDKTTNVSLSNGNCYNGITSVAQALQLYPVFDCVNRTVALHQFSGKNYGLVYSLGRNIMDDSTKLDGEKVITKLYCTGGKDYNGDVDINIGDAVRDYFKHLNGFYKEISDAPVQEVEGFYAITDSGFNADDFTTDVYALAEKYTVGTANLPQDTYYIRKDEENYYKFTTDKTFVSGDKAIYVLGDSVITFIPANTSQEKKTYNVEIVHYDKHNPNIDLNKVLDCTEVSLETITKELHDTSTNEYWVERGDRAVYFWDNDTWNLGTETEDGYWTYTYIITDPESGFEYPQEYTVDPISGTLGKDWDPNDDMYITSRSPYGTNYILNLKWAYQNKWITKEQILELYQEELKLHNLNVEFMDKYIEDYRLSRQLRNEAANNYDIAQDGFESTLNAMMNKYYNNDQQPSQGSTYCFHTAPVGTYLKGDGKHYIKIGHCYRCGATQTIEPSGNAAGADWDKCPDCEAAGSDIQCDEIYIPVYDDFRFVYTESDYPHGTDVTNQYSGPAYNPKLKGYYEKLVITLDRQDGQGDAEAGKDVAWYENVISLIKPIDYKNGEMQDGYNYVLPDGKGGTIWVKAASGQIEVWNESVEKYISEYGKMLTYYRKMMYLIKKIEALNEIYENWTDIEEEINANIQHLFGDYLIEGNYTNKEQPYVALLFDEGLDASDKYCIPEVTYNLNVIDSSGLVEYRIPPVTKYRCVNCDYVSYSPINECPVCGQNSFITEHDIYNDLIKSLQSVGQIIPKAGDYVTIYDEPMGFFGVPGLVTKISRYIDNPVNNKIEIDTAYTDDEKLVGNIITATNTVLNNGDIYTRTAILKSNGTIDPDSIRESLDNAGANVTIVGTDGNILLDGSGLKATDPDNPHNAFRYSGKGVFMTTSYSPEEGAAIMWSNIISPQGINANYINSGSIDTQKITILSGKSAKVLLDQNGLTVKNSVQKSSHISSFNASLAKEDAGYARAWGEDRNIASFIGVDNQNNALVYTKGFLVANEGSNIANWITSDNGFYHLNNQGKKDLWLSPTGMTRDEYSSEATLGEANTPFMIYAGDKFGVDTSGKMYAKGAVVDGSGSFSGNISATSGSIGNWQINNGAIKYSNDVYLGSDGSIKFKNFSVSTTGAVTATSANITGTITATAGTIGGCSINSNGNLIVTNGHITSLDAGKISSGTLNIQTKGGGYLTAGAETTHVNVSGINTHSYGINMHGEAGISNAASISSNGAITVGTNGQAATITAAGSLTLAQGISAGGQVSIPQSSNFKVGTYAGKSGSICLKSVTREAYYVWVQGGIIVGFSRSQHGDLIGEFQA